MARYSAKEEKWTPMEIRGVQGYFCDMRINQATVPEYFHLWELADECDAEPCRYRPGILVNFYGTFITTGELPVDDAGYVEGYINTEDEWGYTDGLYSFTEIEQMEGVDKNGQAG